MIKLIIFDLGGVCFEVDWLKINDEMINKFHISTLVKSKGNKKAFEYYQKALEGKVHPREMFKALDNQNNNLEEVIPYYKEIYKKYKHHHFKIYDLIKKLKEKYTVVCLSDTNVIHYEAHKEQGTINDFHHVFTSFQIGSIKRDPNTFKFLLKKVALNSKEVLFIDDNVKNIEVAESLGIKGIHYLNYENLIKQFKEMKLL